MKYISVGELIEKAKIDLRSEFAKVNWTVYKVNQDRKKEKKNHVRFRENRTSN